MSAWQRWKDWWSDVDEGLGLPSSRQRENAKKLANEQMQNYKQQTELTKQELARKRDEQVAEKRRVEAKQIRSLRHNYRSQGMLGNSGGAQDMNEKLGG